MVLVIEKCGDLGCHVGSDSVESLTRSLIRYAVSSTAKPQETVTASSTTTTQPRRFLSPDEREQPDELARITQKLEAREKARAWVCDTGEEAFKMSTAARRRLMRDFKRMQTDPPAGVSASPIADNVMTWYAFIAIRRTRLVKWMDKRLICLVRRNAVIIGPSDTPFEDGTFRLVMHFEEQYPNKPPGVKFISQMFHPNVYGTGELCLDILQNRWSPTYDVAAILTSIQR